MTDGLLLPLLDEVFVGISCYRPEGVLAETLKEAQTDCFQCRSSTDFRF